MRTFGKWLGRQASKTALDAGDQRFVGRKTQRYRGRFESWELWRGEIKQLGNKRFVLSTLLFIGVATAFTTHSASAGSLLGHWMCIDKIWGGPRTFDVTFSPNGKLEGVITMKYRKAGHDFSARAIYKSRWRLEGNKLFDNPYAVKITDFTVDGKRAMRSHRVRKLRKSLLADQLEPATVQFVSQQKHYIQFGRIKATCRRLASKNTGG